MTLKKFTDNKILTGTAIVVFGLVLSWGIWVTSGVYQTDKAQEVTKVATDSKIDSICTDLNELRSDFKSETKDIKKELQDQRDMIFTNNEKVMEKLGGISKSLKNRP